MKTKQLFILSKLEMDKWSLYGRKWTISLPVTESEGPGPDLITVDEVAGGRLHSDITAQRRKLS